MAIKNRLSQARSTILSAPYRRWLLNHGDAPLPQWVVERIAQELLKAPRLRQGSFSASEAGTCMRRQQLSYIGLDKLGEYLQEDLVAVTDPQLQNIFNDGKWRHLRWQANLLASGAVDDIEVPLRMAKKRSRGTVDAVGTVPDNHPVRAWRGKRFGVELKGVQMYQYTKYVQEDTQMEKHKGQFMRYVLAGQFDLFVVLYENKNFNDFHEWVVVPTQREINEARRELRALNEAVDRKELLPMLASCKARFGRAWDQCPYKGRGGVCESMADWID